MIEMKDVNREIRIIVNPFLKEIGFSLHHGKNYWAFPEGEVRMACIRAVGAYFSAVTGWPSMSLVVELGVYYPHRHEGASQSHIKRDEEGRLLPKDWQCDRKYTLTAGINQDFYKKNLSNPAERKRIDIWWIDPDGSNLEESIQDMKNSLGLRALEWFNGEDGKS